MTASSMSKILVAKPYKVPSLFLSCFFCSALAYLLSLLFSFSVCFSILAFGHVYLSFLVPAPSTICATPSFSEHRRSTSGSELFSVKFRRSFNNLIAFYSCIYWKLTRCFLIFDYDGRSSPTINSMKAIPRVGTNSGPFRFGKPDLKAFPHIHYSLVVKERMARFYHFHNHKEASLIHAESRNTCHRAYSSYKRPHRRVLLHHIA